MHMQVPATIAIAYLHQGARIVLRRGSRGVRPHRCQLQVSQAALPRALNVGRHPQVGRGRSYGLHCLVDARVLHPARTGSRSIGRRPLCWILRARVLNGRILLRLDVSARREHIGYPLNTPSIRL